MDYVVGPRKTEKRAVAMCCNGKDEGRSVTLIIDRRKRSIQNRRCTVFTITGRHEEGLVSLTSGLAIKDVLDMLATLHVLEVPGCGRVSSGGRVR